MATFLTKPYFIIGQIQFPSVTFCRLTDVGFLNETFTLKEAYESAINKQSPLDIVYLYNFTEGIDMGQDRYGLEKVMHTILIIL